MCLPAFSTMSIDRGSRETHLMRGGALRHAPHEGGGGTGGAIVTRPTNKGRAMTALPSVFSNPEKMAFSASR